MNNKSVYLKIIVNYIMTILTVLAVVFLVPRLIAFLWPFFVGWIIALIANPLVRFLEKKLKILRKHGTAIVIIFVLAVVISLMYLLVYFIINQAISFSKDFPQIYAGLSESMAETVSYMKERFTFLPDKVFIILDGIVNNFGGFVNDIASDFMDRYEFSINDAGNIVKSVAEALFMTIITILNSYFLTAEHDKIAETYKKIVPERIKKMFSTISKCSISAFGGYFKAQFKIMCVIFLILVVGLLCIGADYAILFAFIIAVIDFLPVFGSGAILWPWCIIEIISGRYINAIVLFALYLLCQAVKQFMQPKMVGDSIGMKPLPTLFFMFVGYRFGGVLGMIIGIPIGMILISFYREGVFDNLIRGGKILVSAYDKWKKY